MDSRLVPINAVIALTTRQGGWPAPFMDAGYVLHSIEAKVHYGEGKCVVVDLALAASAQRAVVLGECKSGRNLRDSQARGYESVTLAQARRDIGFPYTPSILQPMIAGLMEHRERILKAIEVARFDVPVLFVGDHEVVLEKDLPGLSAFRARVPGPPPRIIPFDALSSDAEFHRYMIQGLVAATAARKTAVGVDALLDAAIPWWAVYSPSGRRDLWEKAGMAIVHLIDQGYRDDYAFETRAGAPGLVRILRNPAENDPHAVTQGWQRLRRQGERALGRRTAPVDSAQLSFSFEELGLEAEIGQEAE
jgi:hypothetical protein